MDCIKDLKKILSNDSFSSQREVINFNFELLKRKVCKIEQEQQNNVFLFPPTPTTGTKFKIVFDGSGYVLSPLDQADWEEVDIEADGYIKNKPHIPSNLQEILSAGNNTNGNDIFISENDTIVFENLSENDTLQEALMLNPDGSVEKRDLTEFLRTGCDLPENVALSDTDIIQVWKDPSQQTSVDDFLLYKAAYVHNKFIEADGWFIPSQEEMFRIYQNLWRGTDDTEGNTTYDPINNLIYPSSDRMITSTEDPIDTGRLIRINFNDGSTNSISKNSSITNLNRTTFVVRIFTSSEELQLRDRGQFGWIFHREQVGQNWLYYETDSHNTYTGVSVSFLLLEVGTAGTLPDFGEGANNTQKLTDVPNQDANLGLLWWANHWQHNRYIDSVTNPDLPKLENNIKWRVPTGLWGQRSFLDGKNDRQVFIDLMNGQVGEASKMKATHTWSGVYANGTDDYNLNLTPTGRMNSVTGNYSDAYESMRLLVTSLDPNNQSNVSVIILRSVDDNSPSGGTNFGNGNPVRLVREVTSAEASLTDGTLISDAYTDNSGNTYDAIKAGDRVWLASYLKDTKDAYDNNITIITNPTNWTGGNFDIPTKAAYPNYEIGFYGGGVSSNVCEPLKMTFQDFKESLGLEVTPPEVANDLSPVLSDLVQTPPTSNNVGDSYIVPLGATGDWSSQVNNIATWDGSDWIYYTPQVNDRTIITTGDTAGNIVKWDGSVWEDDTPSISSATPFNLAGTSIDAGSNKTSGIAREGNVTIGDDNAYPEKLRVVGKTKTNELNISNIQDDSVTTVLGIQSNGDVVRVEIAGLYVNVATNQGNIQTNALAIAQNTSNLNQLDSEFQFFKQQAEQDIQDLQDNINYLVSYTEIEEAATMFDFEYQITSITPSTTIDNYELSINGGAFSTPTLPLTISANAYVIFKIEFESGEDKGVLNVKGIKQVS